ncbi:MAG: urate hydroxylase PuuD [Deltaproteobacteria bacterium]|nr:urate hydroxylase PuuD [Deltaproteobacteria bacterium]
MSLFSADGFLFLLRWGHFLAGIMWIGLLWYFNFVQGAFFAETDAATKNNATSKLVPRALWWFRWGAMFTFLTGIIMITGFYHQTGGAYLESPAFSLILLGATMGILMFLNVWLVIWPKQQIVIASTNAVLGGGQANPAAAAAGRRAFLASRTNTLFSIPMLFFMGASRHLGLGPLGAGGMILLLAIIFLVEANALVGTAGPTKQPIEKPPALITSGFVLTAILYLLYEGLAG